MNIYQKGLVIGVEYSLPKLAEIFKVEEIAKSIYYLGSAENTYITGQIVAVSGGEWGK